MKLRNGMIYGPDDPLEAPPPSGETIEIARSFSFKMNLGNYESADFFCSAKKRVAAEDAEPESEALYQFCRSQIRKNVAEWKRGKIQPQISQRRTA